MDLRAKYNPAFEKKHGVKLGFMSVFVKAAVEALKTFPLVNARIEGGDVVMQHFYDIGVAVSTERGLVVPVVRDADKLGFADVEKAIAAVAKKARDGKIGMADMEGGTFTITNGGTFGSMLSTPILNPPQAAILGMHNIQKRAVVVRRRDRDPADDVLGPELRPPADRRPGGGAVPGADQGLRREPGADAVRGVRSCQPSAISYQPEKAGYHTVSSAVLVWLTADC